MSAGVDGGEFDFTATGNVPSRAEVVACAPAYPVVSG